MYLYPESRVTDEFGSTGHCAVTEHTGDQRYLAAELLKDNAALKLLVVGHTDNVGRLNHGAEQRIGQGTSVQIIS